MGGIVKTFNKAGIDPISRAVGIEPEGLAGKVTGAFGLSGGNTSTTTETLSAEEREFIGLQSELARKQLANIDQLQPFQRELLELSLADLRRQGVDTAALDKAITPEQRASAAKSDFERTQRLGPIQDELLQLQLDELRRGGAASPEQLARIKEATERGIESGSADIDLSTQRGIGLISDELANSRGLRMTDTPILREATLLARSGADQKAGLIRSMRAGEASAALNYPLAVQNLQSGINLNQQSVGQNAQQFQAQLRQQAYQNRLALTGQTAQTGIGLSSIGGQMPRGARSSTTQQGTSLGEIGALAGGLGAAWLAFSDARLKKDYGVVARTDDGIALHAYRFKGEDERDPLRLGVIAQEVEAVRPQAVRTHSSGYKVVRYDMIG